MKKYLITCLTLIFITETYADDALITLKQSYLSALATNQVSNIHKAKLGQSEELIVQSKSNFYPKLNLKGNYSAQENLADNKYVNLNLTHTLYKGGKDLINLDLANNSKEIANQTEYSEKINLYISVINSYYNYFLYENDAKNLELLTKQSNDRVLEIQKRVNIGRSRLGELLQAKAQFAQAEAQLENAKGLVFEARKKFEALTGTKGLKPEIDLNTQTNIYTINDLISKSKIRPDLKVKELKIEQARLNLASSRRSIFPTIDLTSNYYLTKRSSSTYAKTDWDLGLVLSLPLFEGFNSDSKISESIWIEHEARYNYADQEKTLELDLISKLETYHRYIGQISSFDLANSLALKSYEEALKDYRLGLISNLEVLTALNLSLDSKRNSEKNKIQALISEKLINASMGVLP